MSRSTYGVTCLISSFNYSFIIFFFENFNLLAHSFFKCYNDVALQLFCVLFNLLQAALQGSNQLVEKCGLLNLNLITFLVWKRCLEVFREINLKVKRFILFLKFSNKFIRSCFYCCKFYSWFCLMLSVSSKKLRTILSISACSPYDFFIHLRALCLIFKQILLILKRL